MSTLEYLDKEGTVNFRFVPWKVLNEWLSELNGNTHFVGFLRDGVNRGKVIAELEARRKKKDTSFQDQVLKAVGRDRGYGEDWREYENEQGYTHLEELLIYQPEDWRKQAREYLYLFDWDLARVSSEKEKREIVKSAATEDDPDFKTPIVLTTPILVTLFHPEMTRTSRYEPLQFLLAYGAEDPLPKLFEGSSEPIDPMAKNAVLTELSPLDYFFEFERHVQTYKFDLLRTIGTSTNFPRLRLMKEFDFAGIIGQRLAKQMIREEIVRHIWNRSTKEELCSNRQPLSMIFAGPSGNGKTELAVWLAKLMNKPDEDAFLKVDCGKLKDADEVFGMSGAYQGAYEGSALNNFILRMSQEPESLGIVLLDEIEKANRGVIHGLYQVIDKGEWTNKKLEQGKGTQTETVPCHNVIFILTTNAADEVVLDFAAKRPGVYTAKQDALEEIQEVLERDIRRKLQKTYPFTDAFMGRVGRVVPFLPMANGDPEKHILQGEMITVAKLLIEREQEKLSTRSDVDVNQLVSSSTKHRMAKIIVRDAIVEAGVRSIQKGVETKMGNRMIHALLLEKGGIAPGGQVRYSANEEDRRIDFRTEASGKRDGRFDISLEDDSDWLG